MPVNRQARVIAAVGLVALCASAAPRQYSAAATSPVPTPAQPPTTLPVQSREDRGMVEAGRRWESQGVQVGEHLDDLTIYTLEGKSARLAKLWKDRPVLLVTASLTCPVARRQCPSLRSIIDAHDPEVRVVLLYTIEAHPKGDPSPYADGEEWVTPQNERANILQRQPVTLEQRLRLAKDMNERLGEIAPMFVDGLDNAVWKVLGGAPNLGILIDTDGTVAAKQGWLNAGDMSSAVAALLKRKVQQAQASYVAGREARPRMELFIEALKSDDRASTEAFYAKGARIWFDQKTGEGTPLGISPWRDWDHALNARHAIESAAIQADMVIVVATEINDFARLIDFSGWRATSTYWFNARGEVTAQLYQRMEVSPTMRDCFQPALDWMKAHKADELRAIYPNNDFAPSAESASRWRNALTEWRAATGRPAVDLAVQED